MAGLTTKVAGFKREMAGLIMKMAGFGPELAGFCDSQHIKSEGSHFNKVFLFFCCIRERLT
jgi:hypothetical protein